MQRLAAFLLSFVTSLFGWFASYFSAKAALVLTFVAATATITLAMFVAAKALIVGVVSLVPYEPFVMGFWACWPSNAETCIAACFGVDIAVFVYRYKLRIVSVLTK